MKYTLAIFFSILGFLITACGTQYNANPIPTWTAMPDSKINQPSSTPDPCAKEILVTSIKPVNDLMREFDDASQLASNISKDQLPPIISNMQRIRRNAQDLNIPTCLVTLKKHELAHMDNVINTLLGFVNNADPNTLNAAIAQARNEHDQYTLEIAHLLGLSPATTTATP